MEEKTLGGRNFLAKRGFSAASVAAGIALGLIRRRRLVPRHQPHERSRNPAGPARPGIIAPRRRRIGDSAARVEPAALVVDDAEPFLVERAGADKEAPAGRDGA